jgi:peptidoglycan hydrolase-like protein with peptidoglycan-binding domain
MKRPAVALLAVVLFATACGGDEAATTTTLPPTTASASTTTTGAPTTTTTEPQPPGFILRGETGPYVEALQFLLNCSGYGPLEMDGRFGPATAGAVEQAQDDLEAPVTGEPTEETFAALSRACGELRNLPALGGEVVARAAGNATRDDADRFTIRAEQAQTMRITVDAPSTIDVTVQGDGGTVLRRPDGSADFSVVIPLTQVYELRVTAAEPTSYLITVGLDNRPPETTTTTEGPGEPVPEVTLDALFAAVTQGDIPAAMLPVAEEVAYHTGTSDFAGADGRERLQQSFTALADDTVGLVFAGIDGSDGDVLTFAATTLAADPATHLFAARFAGARIVEWWDQPSDVAGGLEALFHRVAGGDVDGAMSLFEMDGITYHRADGTTFTGGDGRAALRERFASASGLALVELTGYADGLATFVISDGGEQSYAARYERAIAEWWEDYLPGE